MSHDIRTPMNAIVGMTTIAGAHLNDPERVQACLRKISLSSKHLLSLINDILDMSKIESGKLTIAQEPFNFAELNHRGCRAGPAAGRRKKSELCVPTGAAGEGRGRWRSAADPSGVY